jgi:hypothetical protein
LTGIKDIILEEERMPGDEEEEDGDDDSIPTAWFPFKNRDVSHMCGKHLVGVY